MIGIAVLTALLFFVVARGMLLHFDVDWDKPDQRDIEALWRNDLCMVFLVCALIAAVVIAMLV